MKGDVIVVGLWTAVGAGVGVALGAATDAIRAWAAIGGAVGGLIGLCLVAANFKHRRIVATIKDHMRLFNEAVLALQRSSGMPAGIDYDNPFVCGFFFGSCQAFTQWSGRQYSQDEVAEIGARTAAAVAKFQWKRLMTNISAFLAENNVDLHRGSEAAFALWGVMMGQIDPRTNVALDHILRQSEGIPRFMNRLGIHHRPDKDGDVVSMLICRIFEEIVHGLRWDEIQVSTK